MTYKTVLSMCMLFVLVPAWIGISWVKFLRIKDGADRILCAYLFGIMTMFAAGQLVLVPLVAASASLTTAVTIIKLLYSVLAVLSFYNFLELLRQRNAKRKVQRAGRRKNGGFIAVFGILAAALILIQAYIPAKYQHIDDDDSRFVSEEVSAVVHDTMLKDDPITDEFMYWNMGEVRKDLASPWTMYAAVCCRIVDAAPAVFSHTLFPFFMILICYAVYAWMGRILFSKDTEKVLLFLIFLSVLFIWDYTSTHTLGAMLLLRIWQGKAIVAGFVIPFLLCLFYEILQSKETGRYPAMLYVTGFAGSLFSGIGIVVIPVMAAVYGLADLIYHRNFKKTLIIWSAAAPCGVYLAYYLIGLI